MRTGAQRALALKEREAEGDGLLESPLPNVSHNSVSYPPPRAVDNVALQVLLPVSLIGASPQHSVTQLPHPIFSGLLRASELASLPPVLLLFQPSLHPVSRQLSNAPVRLYRTPA